MITVKDFEFMKPAVRAGWTELDLSKEWDAFRVYKIGVVFTLWSYFEALWAQANVNDDIKGVTRSVIRQITNNWAPSDNQQTFFNNVLLLSHGERHIAVRYIKIFGPIQSGLQLVRVRDDSARA